MTRPEFAAVIAYLAAGVGKAISPESQEVYFGLLGDLSVEVFSIAAKCVLLEHRWATFPSVAELREAAALTARGQVNELSAAEAWRLAWIAAGRIDPEMEGSAERHLEAVPPIVAEAMLVFGIPALCFGREPVSVTRAQFTKIFEQLSARERRLALLPSAVVESVREIPERSYSPAIIKALNLIGRPGEQAGA